MTIEVQTAYDGRVTDVRVTWRDLVGHGTARCNPTDVPVTTIGYVIALGRALQDLGRQVEQDGIQLPVSHQDFDAVMTTMSLIQGDLKALAGEVTT